MTSKISKKDHPIVWLPCAKLSYVWAEAQRPLDPRKSRRIRDELDPDAFGVIVVTAETAAGLHHIIDGGHRWDAINGDDPTQKVPCLVINTTDPARAAEIWHKMNAGRTKPSAIERFKVAVTAGRAAECAVAGLLDGLGYRVAKDKQPGCLSAVEVCLSLQRRAPGGLELLRQTLLVIQAAWGRTPESVAGTIIRGVAELLVDHGEEIDRDRLVACMAKKTNPARLLSDARGISYAVRSSLPVSIARILREYYNSGLRKHKLESKAA